MDLDTLALSRKYLTFYNEIIYWLNLLRPYSTVSNVFYSSRFYNRVLTDFINLFLLASCSLSLRIRMGIPVSISRHLNIDYSSSWERSKFSKVSYLLSSLKRVHWLLMNKHISVFLLFVRELRKFGIYLSTKKRQFPMIYNLRCVSAFEWMIFWNERILTFL